MEIDGIKIRLVFSMPPAWVCSEQLVNEMNDWCGGAEANWGDQEPPPEQLARERGGRMSSPRKEKYRKPKWTKTHLHPLRLTLK